MGNPEIIYEDENVVVVNKPAGLVVHASRIMDHGSKTDSRSKIHAPRNEPTLVEWLLKKYPEIKTVGDDPGMRPGIVHRLDKETSGVMLVAKNQASFLYLKSLFAKHEIQKTYCALVVGDVSPKTGVIDAPIGIRSGTLKRSVRSKKMAKSAITRYRVIEKFNSLGGHFSLLEIRPETGRTHQIRVHLASIGHPVVGDRLYGSKRANQMLDTTYNLQPTSYKLPVRLMLHARSLEFTAADGKRIKIEAEPPSGFQKIITGLNMVQ